MLNKSSVFLYLLIVSIDCSTVTDEYCCRSTQKKEMLNINQHLLSH